MLLMSFAESRWAPPTGQLVDLVSAVNGSRIAQCSSAGLDFGAMARHARSVGGPALRQLTFHQRAVLLKRLGIYLMERKDELYELSYDTGATKKDGWVDIEGGIGTLFAFSSKGRRELPDERFLLEGPVEALSKGGTFVGRHMLTPLQGVAVHVNAFNFPCWGMLEKLAPAILAGVPAIVKPASPTAWLAEAMFRMIVESGILPDGSVQFIAGSVGDLLDHLTGQDIVSFTGSIGTSEKLRNHPVVTRNAVRFVAERDSLNASVLAPDAVAGTPEFDLFVKEVVREMTVKAGQKCTAIRRAIVPAAQIDAVQEAISARLAKIVVGDPRREDVGMGALASRSQRDDVLERVRQLRQEARLVYGDPENFAGVGEGTDSGAFLSPMLLRADEPMTANNVHSVEAFGPVSTLLPYRDVADAVQLVQRGEGSLVASVFTYDAELANQLVFGAASFHGRMILVDRDNFKESTGHGSPLPQLIHGGPGRAGGGEEMGGTRGVEHYMQRTALQASPGRMTSLTKSWVVGSPVIDAGEHPFRQNFEQLQIGKTLFTEPRVVTLADIEHFAEFTGDNFYAHMDEEAAAANPFFPGRVAHGYLLLSFAAGLFVDAAPGPVLANYGLEGLRFVKPVSPGDAIRVRLTAKSKSSRSPEYGEVRWDVAIFNQSDETVATYELLTMNARSRSVFELSEEQVVPGDAAAIWNRVADFGGIDKWHKSIESSSLLQEGEPKVGSTRTLTMVKTGGVAIEQISELDHTARRLGYTIVESPLPVTGFLSTITVKPVDGGAAVSWTARFEAADTAGPEVLEGVRRAIVLRGLKGLAG